MNKDYFEQKMWKFSYDFDNILHFDKGDVWSENGKGAFLTFNIKDNNLIIITTDKGFNMDGPNLSPKFNGYCENSETFELICKLIRLKI